MSTIIPACIPENLVVLEAFIKRYGSLSDELQIDIVDGRFVPSISWPYNAESIFLERELTRVDFRTHVVEIDLMVAHPETVLDAWVATGASKLVVHVESTHKLPEILEHAGTHAYALGLAFNNDTELTLLNSLDIACVDYVQLMGIAHIGKQGEPFDERVLERVTYIKEQYPGMVVSIDGSVNLTTIPSLRNVGVDVFVVGSALLKAEDPEERYQELLKATGAV